MTKRAAVALAGAMLALALIGSASAQGDKSETAIFASGCFWCTQADFQKVAGVASVVSGYTGGQRRTPPIAR